MVLEKKESRLNDLEPAASRDGLGCFVKLVLGHEPTANSLHSWLLQHLAPSDIDMTHVKVLGIAL